MQISLSQAMPNCNKEPNHSIDLWPESRNLTDEDNYFLDLIIKSYENTHL
jgi:hypothetical protein